MSNLNQITEKVMESDAAIMRIKNLISLYPERTALLLSLKSHERFDEKIKKEYADAAKMSRIDICKFRLFFAEGATPKIPSLANALLYFQTLYSLVVDALVSNKPKTRSQISAESLEKSTFEFGYSFSGSIGFAMSLPNDRLLNGESFLDRAIATTFDLLKANRSDQIAALSKRLGSAVIKEAYRWAETLSVSGIGAEISWCRDEEIINSVNILPAELRDLQKAILEFSDNSIEDITLICRLIGSDLREDGIRTFHLTFADDGEVLDIRGKMADANGIVKLPTDCSAKLEVTTHIDYATDTETKEYRLLSFEAIS